jgi:hypothetical protein
MQLKPFRFSQISSLLLLTTVMTALAYEQAIKHPNGQIAYEHREGYYPVVRHSNGQVAWTPRDGYYPVVFHSNGRVAWTPRDGYYPQVVYFDGKIAWNGQTCYHPNGELLKQNCKGVVVNLGEGISASISDNGNGGTLAHLDVYGHQVVVKR